MENIALDLTLVIDSFKTSAETAKSELRDIAKEANETQKALTMSIKGSLTGATSGLNNATNKLGNVGGGLIKGFGGAGENLLGSAGAASGLLLGAGIGIGTVLIEKATEFVEVVMKGFVEAAKQAVKVIADQEKINLSYRLVLGTEQGKNALEDINRFAKLTSYTRTEIASKIQSLYKIGFNPQQVRDIFAAGIDVAAMSPNPTNIENVNPALEFAKSLRARGGFQERQLRTIAQDVGFQVSDFVDRFAKLMGTTAEDALKQAKKGRSIKVEAAAREAFLEIIEAKAKAAGLEGSISGTTGNFTRLGAAGEKERQTLGATLHKIIELPNQYFSKLADSNALPTFTNRLQKLYDYFDPDGAHGQEMLNRMDKLFTKITDIVTKLTSNEGFSAMNTVLTVLLGTVKFVIDGISDVTHAMMSWIAHIRELVGKETPESRAVLKQERLGQSALEIASGIYAGDQQKVISLAAKQLGVTPELLSIAVNKFKTDRKSGATFVENLSQEQILNPSFIPKEATPDGNAVKSFFSGESKFILNTPVTINVTAAPGEDPTHTAQTVGRLMGDLQLRYMEIAKEQMGR